MATAEAADNSKPASQRLAVGEEAMRMKRSPDFFGSRRLLRRFVQNRL